MMVHHYDRITGAFTGSTPGDRDPRDTARVVIPAYATQDAPPALDAPLYPFFKAGEGWVAETSLKGGVYYDPDAGPVPVNEHVYEIPEGCTLTPPPSTRHYLDRATASWVERPWTAPEVKAKRQRLLSQSDWTQLRDVALDDATAAAWEVYRQALRDVTSQEGYPENVVWPTAPNAQPATAE